ncbi:ankyrin repeat domain-containing protein 26 isoform X8 [Pangasianodon hypophthalmus]|uniref:ankyrin repeat domain-containing protein 26 isoform X8 n=1 Tax=Pangasianodon hypophthalmus TaxID=310915 RepID=UPI0023072C1C|nr:ankyrin repeat domain-containing protein 26 isoform X8 [Pangasianodon hypophthalmus]
MKKIFHFTKRRKGSPSASETASVLSVGYDLKEKDLGKVHKAAFTGDVTKLKQLAKKNDLNQLDKENRTALHIACVHGHTEVVQYLVENKVKLNLCDNQNCSALMKAVQCQQDRCVSILLEHEADPNLVDINGNTALHLAARIPSLPVALKLLEHEANINAQNKEGNTPLILSVEENHAEMAEFLLKEGADVNLQNQERRTPLLIAACNGQISMVRLLLQYNADITVKDNKGWSSDDYAVMNGHHACSHLIVEHGTKRKPLQSPSHLGFNKNKQTSLLGSPEAGFALGGPTLGKDGGSAKEEGRDTEDNSHADSISRASKSGAADSWPSTDDDDDDDDDEELDLGPKKPQKLNLKQLMSASKIEGKRFAVDQDPDKSWSGTESEPISKSNAVEHMAFPGSSTSTQLPVTPKPISFSNLPQMTSTPLISSQKEREEESSSEDDYEEEDVDEECDEVQNERSDVEHLQKTETSKKRDFLSELGIEKEDEEEDSPWDSELSDTRLSQSGSDSPSKKEQSGLNSPTKSHKPMTSIHEEGNEALHYIPSFLRGSKHSSVFRSFSLHGGQEAVVLRTSQEEENNSDEEKSEKQNKLLHREPVSVLSKLLESTDARKKTDVMEELGLGDVDDLEDASDWDSASITSKASKNLSVYKPEEELASETPVPLPVVREQELRTSVAETQGAANTKKEEGKESSLLGTRPLPSPRSFKPLTSTQPQPQPQTHIHKESIKKPVSEEESDWDTDTTNSPAKMTTPLPNIVETETVSPPEEDGESDCNSEASEHPEEGGVAKAGVMRGEPKSSALRKTHGSGKQSDVDQGKGKKADTNPDKPSPKQEETCDSGSQQKDDKLKKREHVSPKWPTRSPRRRTTLLDDEAKRAMGSQGNLLHVPAPKQSRDPCPVNHHNGGPLSVFDDSTLSEVSEDEGRSPSSRHRAEKKNGGELEMADDFEDLTQSSDTATEELDSATSGYFNASLLIKQLDTSSLDSVSMVKLQNMFHEYEHTIQKERNRHSRLADKVSQLEQERNELKLLLDESRESKSSLEHLRLELETDLNNLKFLLKQEQEKHQSASMLYDKTREQLFRKEEQHRDEAEEREKVELKMRNLELELRAMMNNMKQLEEDRNETQRLLAHEQSARALQEDLLNSHLRKQQDIEEKNLRNLTKSNEAASQLTETSERERELQQQVCTLQEELSSVRAELEHFRSLSRQEESRLVDERDALRERLEDARRDLKLNEETLAQTVFQYNGQVSTLKSECALLSTKLEHERQVRQQLEAEAETSKARLQVALQETERCQAARAETERTQQREREQHQRSEEKWTSESSSQRDTIQSLSQKLSEAEARTNSLENEWHRATLSVAEKSALLETAAREREQARARLEELEGTLQSERDRASRATARHDAMQERLAQAQSEGALLRQQLEEAQNRGTAKEQAVTDAQECFTQALNQLRANGEERVQLVEERSKELATKNAELREQNYRQEQEKADRESSLRQLQQELADSLKKLSMCEASLEVNTRYRSDLEDEKVRNQKDMDRLKGKLQESEEHNIQVERRINTLMGTLDEKERDLISTGQKLQEVLAATTRSEQTIKQLEEAVQRLEIENARLEATVKQQNNRIEILQKEAQEATALTDSSPGGGVRNQLENLVTNLQSSKMTLEDQLNREVQKQSMLSHNAHDSQALWEEELKNRSRFGLRLAELEKEKGELTNQMELEKKKAKKIAEQKKAVDARLDQEMNRNTELQKEMYRLRTLVKTAKKKLREQDGGELGSPLGSLRGELSYRQNETEGAVSRMKIKVDELQMQLEREASRCSKLEDMNRELKEQLSSLKSLGRSHERLERSKQQLEEELTGLRRRVEAGVMDQSQAEQFRRETEERARQEIRHKLDEINLFLQTQAASQEVLEQMKAANEASQRAEMEQRIRELEAELSRAHTTQQDSLLQRDSSRTELERYRQLYTDELRLRKSLTTKLERSNERLAEANAKLLSERQRSKSLLSSSIINGSLGGPALDTHPSLGRLGLGASLLSPVGEQHTNRVEAYLAKMQSELEKNISKELDYGTSELEGASTRMPPVGSACGSQKNLNSNLNVEQQDPLSRATQQYLEVLKKNYMI